MCLSGRDGVPCLRAAWRCRRFLKLVVGSFCDVLTFVLVADLVAGAQRRLRPGGATKGSPSAADYARGQPGRRGDWVGAARGLRNAACQLPHCLRGAAEGAGTIALSWCGPPPGESHAPVIFDFDQNVFTGSEWFPH